MMNIPMFIKDNFRSDETNNYLARDIIFLADEFTLKVKKSIKVFLYIPIEF